MNHRRNLRIIAAVGLFVSGCFVGVGLDSTYTFYFADHDTLVPAYYTIDLQNGLSGVIKLRVAFDKGKVSTVSVLSTDLRSITDFSKRHPNLVELSRDRIVRTIKGWTSSIVSPFSTDVTVELALDTSLPPNARQYRIENGTNGVVTRLVMSGPYLDELKKPAGGGRND